MKKTAAKEGRKPKSTKRKSAQQKPSSNSILQVVHETASGLYKAGLIEKTTMREFDYLCLPEVPDYTPDQIKDIRDRLNLSQSVFAAYLNTSISSIQKWETGAKRPNSVAMKLLNIVDKQGLDVLVL